MAASSSIMITSGFSASRVCVETGGSDLRKSARSTVISSLLSFIAQCLRDRRKQRLRVERFAKEPAYSLSPRLISNLMATRDQENRQLSMTLPDDLRSEEHKSELQSLMRISSAVFRLKK